MYKFMTMSWVLTPFSCSPLRKQARSAQLRSPSVRVAAAGKGFGDTKQRQVSAEMLGLCVVMRHWGRGPASCEANHAHDDDGERRRKGAKNAALRFARVCALLLA